jgi:hypothetical protein
MNRAAGCVALAALIAMSACSGGPNWFASQDEQRVWVPSSSDRCEYLNFGILSEFSGQERLSGLANEKVLRDVEEVYSQEFEAIGFHPAGDGEKPWLFLRAVLQESDMRENTITGGVELSATPSLHRDYMLAWSDGFAPVGPIGLIVATEIGTRWNRLDSRVRLDEMARANAKIAWNRTAPLLFEMCAWKKQLIEEGLTLKDFRRELVGEMDRIRRAHREADQQRKLQLEVEQ